MASSRYRADIDGLRAVAIALVVLYHAFPEAVPGGYIGVDVFFVISGFLITGIIARELAEGRFSLLEFYARRVRRIFPAHLAALAGVAAIGAVLLGPAELRRLWTHIVGGATFTSNFLLWGEAGYFDAAAETKPLLHLWSLAIEEQFYLVWPLAAMLAWRLRGSVLGAAAVIGLASFAASAHSIGGEPAAAFYAPWNRFWELMLGGALAARMPEDAGSACGARANALSAAGAALIAIGLLVLDRESAFPGPLALLPALGTALVVLGGTGAWLNRALLASRGLVALGLRAFPLYLWHWPLLVFLQALYPEGAPVAPRIAAVALAGLLAHHTYELIEQPVRRRGARPAALALAGACAAVAAIGVAGMLAKLAPAEGLEAQLQAAAAWPDEQLSDAACRARHPAAPYCRLANPGMAATHALLGDSQANQFYPGLAAEIGRAGGNLLHLGAPGCVPLAQLDTGYFSHGQSCRQIIGRALEIVLEDKGVRTVVLAANWHLYATGRRFSAWRNRAAPLRLTAAEYPGMSNAEIFPAALAQTIGRLQAAGKRVVILRQVPELPGRIEGCIERLRTAMLAGASARCETDRRRVEAYVEGYLALMAKPLAAHPGVAVLDPLPALCDAERCHAVIDGELLYRDDLHLSAAGSKRVAALIWQ